MLHFKPALQNAVLFVRRTAAAHVYKANQLLKVTIKFDTFLLLFYILYLLFLLLKTVNKNKFWEDKIF